GRIRERPGFRLEDLDERGADDPALPLRVLDAGEVLEEAGRRVDVADVELHRIAEDRDHLPGLAPAAEAVVDEDAGQAVADGAMDERRGHGRVDAAGERTEDPSRARALANAGHPGLSETSHRPRRRRAADPEDEVAQDLAPIDGVRDLGME